MNKHHCKHIVENCSSEQLILEQTRGEVYLDLQYIPESIPVCYSGLRMVSHNFDILRSIPRGGTMTQNFSKGFFFGNVVL